MARLRLLVLLMWCWVGWTLSAPTPPDLEASTAAFEHVFDDQISATATPEGVARALTEAEPVEEVPPNTEVLFGSRTLRRHTVPPTRAGPSAHDRRSAAVGHPNPRRGAPRRDPAERAPPSQT